MKGNASMSQEEAISLLEGVLDTFVPLVEVGNGTTDEMLRKACDQLFQFRDHFLKPKGLYAERPEIVCLCGSGRFMDTFYRVNHDLTLRGIIVLSIGVSKHLDTAEDHFVGESLGPGQLIKLDELHLRKIDLADSILVLNVGGYIGESTKKEIEYAHQHHKPVEYLEEAPLVNKNE